MAPLIIDCCDAAIRVADGETLIAEQPAFARVSDGQVVAIGDAAVATARRHPRQTFNDFWSRTSDAPLPGQALSRADLVHAQLKALLNDTDCAGRDVVLIVPGAADRGALSLLLGILTSLQLKPLTLVNAALASTRAHYREQTPTHLELGLQAAWASRLHQGKGQVSVAESRALDGVGLMALQERWLEFFAASFVRECRFDPLHSADSEQQLADLMPDWLAALAASEQVTLQLTQSGRTLAVEASRVDVVNAVAALYQQIADMTRAVLAGAATPALQMRASIAELPGFAEFMTARIGGHFFVVDDSAALTGVAERLAHLERNPQQMQSVLPVDSEILPPTQQIADTAAAPTHLLYAERALPLRESAPLAVGADAASEHPRFLQLEGMPPGVSGLHCEIVLQDGRCQLVDHSRYGTFLNGNRISGSAVLQPGDTLRVGTPGVELRLIREQEL